MASDMSAPLQVIGNPYDASIFKTLSSVERESDLIFVGRLVSDKGVQVLIHAVAVLKSHGHRYGLTVVGSGPEEGDLRRLVSDLELQDQVHFVGTQTGVQLAAMLNSHKVLVVPSVWREPFGVVALEGSACGCVIIGSDGGGLPEAIGPCGVTFPNGSIDALASRILELCSTSQRLESYRNASAAHLAEHSPPVVAATYLDLFESAIKLSARN
jgi:glycosyltransferase involved in cell wall biosynthesis